MFLSIMFSIYANCVNDLKSITAKYASYYHKLSHDTKEISALDVKHVLENIEQANHLIKIFQKTFLLSLEEDSADRDNRLLEILSNNESSSDFADLSKEFLSKRIKQTLTKLTILTQLISELSIPYRFQSRSIGDYIELTDNTTEHMVNN